MNLLQAFKSCFFIHVYQDIINQNLYFQLPAGVFLLTFPGLHFKAEQHNNSLPSQVENGGFFSNNCSAESFVSAVQHPGRLTFADRSVACVTRLAGAAVTPDHVEAQGVLVAVVLPAEALIML